MYTSNAPGQVLTLHIVKKRHEYGMETVQLVIKTDLTKPCLNKPILIL